MHNIGISIGNADAEAAGVLADSVQLISDATQSIQEAAQVQQVRFELADKLCWMWRQLKLPARVRGRLWAGIPRSSGTYSEAKMCSWGGAKACAGHLELECPKGMPTFLRHQKGGPVQCSGFPKFDLPHAHPDLSKKQNCHETGREINRHDHSPLQSLHNVPNAPHHRMTHVPFSKQSTWQRQRKIGQHNESSKCKCFSYITSSLPRMLLRAFCGLLEGL